MMSDSSVDTKFPYQLLLIDRTVSKFCKAFAIDQKKKKKLSKLNCLINSTINRISW